MCDELTNKIPALPRMPYIAMEMKNYSTPADFWKAMTDLIKTLTENNYETLIKYEGCGIYRIDYADTDRELGGPFFEGLEWQHLDLLNSYIDGVMSLNGDTDGDENLFLNGDTDGDESFRYDE